MQHFYSTQQKAYVLFIATPLGRINERKRHICTAVMAHMGWHICAREAVHICPNIYIMLCVPVHGSRLRRGRGNASLGQPLRPWHDSSDLSPLLFAQPAQIRFHAGRDHGAQGAPRPASPSSGRRCRRGQPFGEPVPFQARLVAHGLRKPCAAALPPRAASPPGNPPPEEPPEQGSGSGRAGGVPGLGSSGAAALNARRRSVPLAGDAQGQCLLHVGQRQATFAEGNSRRRLSAPSRAEADLSGASQAPSAPPTAPRPLARALTLRMPLPEQVMLTAARIPPCVAPFPSSFSAPI